MCWLQNYFHRRCGLPIHNIQPSLLSRSSNHSNLCWTLWHINISRRLCSHHLCILFTSALLWLIQCLHKQISQTSPSQRVAIFDFVKRYISNLRLTSDDDDDRLPACLSIQNLDSSSSAPCVDAPEQPVVSLLSLKPRLPTRRNRTQKSQLLPYIESGFQTFQK